MGVTIVQPYPIGPDKNAAQVMDFIQKRILNLGANVTGPFLVDCETYYSQPLLGSPTKILHVVHNSEQPATVFSVLESNSKNICFCTDTLFDLLLLKLSTFYSKKSRIESKGSRYEIGDFVVKLGLVSVAGSFKGILVEVEYLPCVLVQSCWDLIHEFIQGFLGSVVPNEMPAFFDRKGHEVYQPADTIQQYLDHFGQLKKTT